MHALTFRFKHAHLRSVAFGKRAVQRVREMTPARFDLMYALRTTTSAKRPVRMPGMEQNTLVQALGLHRSTVSKLIRRLKELGWVLHERALVDRRTKVVRLTLLGLRRIERAMRIILQQHVHLKWFENFFKAREHEGVHVLERIDAFWWDLRDIAKGLGDVSSIDYDYGGDALDH